MWSGNISFFLFFNNIVVCANPPIHYGPLILNKNKCVRIPSGKNIRKCNKKKVKCNAYAYGFLGKGGNEVLACVVIGDNFSVKWSFSANRCCPSDLLFFFITAYFYSLKKSWVIKRTLSSILLTSSCCLSFYKEFKCITMFANNSYFITNNTHRMIYLSENRSSARRDFKMRLGCI